MAHGVVQWEWHMVRCGVVGVARGEVGVARSVVQWGGQGVCVCVCVWGGGTRCGGSGLNSAQLLPGNATLTAIALGSKVSTASQNMHCTFW